MSIVANKVEKSLGNPPTHILKGISLEIKKGEFVSLTGRSGSGKSTLLYLLSSLDYASNGTIEINGKDVARMKPQELSVFRNQNLGFVFQFHYLLAELSAIENVLMPAKKAGRDIELHDFAASLLDQFGLGNKLHRLPRQLSGGEQQRVAIARALVMSPEYLFADEPTGSLDSVNSETVMRILQESNKQRGTTVIMVTHDPGYAQLAQRRIHLVDGQISSELN